MDQIRAMQVLVRTIELGSLSAAARELGTTQPTASKIVAQLERALQVRLVERTTTSIALTAAGSRFYEHAKRMLEDHAEAVAAARGLTEQPAGLLRINAPLGFGEMHLHRIARNFLAAYPKIQIELLLNDRYVDLVKEGVDLTIRLSGPLPPDVVARTLATSERFLAASRQYVASHPKIRSLADLQNHEFIRFGWLSSGSKLEMVGPTGAQTVLMPGRYSVNSALSIRDFIRTGGGVSMAPGWLMQDLIDDGTVIRVLPRWKAQGHELRVIYPTRRYQPVRTRVFMNFLSTALLDIPGFTVS